MKINNELPLQNLDRRINWLRYFYHAVPPSGRNGESANMRWAKNVNNF
jgi:hypothetical protein